LLCPNCGMDVTGGAESCPSCGEPIPDPSSAPKTITSPTAGLSAAARPVVYAGFWLRLFAYLIDTFLLGIVIGLAILRPMMDRAGITPDNPWILITGTSRQIFAINLATSMASWLYWALMESSVWQATLGKKVLGLMVTDLEGRRVSFARASGRYFGKILSVLSLLFGFAMAGFTEKKQALHDIIAGCLVVKKV
jgi:uncharacterized RDD family membrane protein YckC